MALPDRPGARPPRPAPRRASAGGGALIALGATGGAAVGFLTRQPTVAFLIGTALGIAAAVAIWLYGRRG